MPAAFSTLIPVPQRARASRGFFDLAGQTCIAHPTAADYAPVKRIVRALKLRLHRDAACAETGLIIGRPRTDVQAPAQAEGYELSISGDGISLAGADLGGLYWGLTTLQQLGEEHKERVPAGRISDWPAFSVRGQTRRGRTTRS